MNKAHYTKIYLEGFQSYGNPTVFELDRGASVTMILGANGKGKSTLVNAIIWAEYGENMKNSVETWEENRPSTYRGARVIVDRNDGEYDYRIARHLNFKGTTLGLKGNSMLMVYKKPMSEPKFLPEHLQGGELHKTDIQKEIINQLGVDSKTFMNSILFGQRMKSFISSDSKDKRELFERMFPTEFVVQGMENAKKEHAEETEKLRNIEVEIRLDTSKLNNLESNLEKVKEYVINFEKKKKLTIDELGKQFEDHEIKVKALNDELVEIDAKLAEINLGDYEEVRKLRNDARDAVSDSEHVLTADNKTLSEYPKNFAKLSSDYDGLLLKLENVETKCPTCDSPIKAAKVKEAKLAISKEIATNKEVKVQLEKSKEDLVKVIDKRSADLVTLKTVRETTAKAFESYDELAKDQQQLTIRRATVVSNLKHVTSQRDAVSLELDKVSADEGEDYSIPTMEEECADLDRIILEKERECKEIDEQIERLNWWIKKGFGASGIKSYIFDAMLNKLNLYIQEYASKLGFGVQFSIDLTKASKPFKTTVYFGDKMKDYADFSGGQKQRVDICLAFAMHDLVSHRTDINILVLDELFEGLDSEGREAALMLIRGKAENKSLYLISHSDIIDVLYVKSVTIEADSLGNSIINEGDGT